MLTCTGKCRELLWHLRRGLYDVGLSLTMVRQRHTQSAAQWS